jgi:hypothetical protein
MSSIDISVENVKLFFGSSKSNYLIIHATTGCAGVLNLLDPCRILSLRVLARSSRVACAFCARGFNVVLLLFNHCLRHSFIRQFRPIRFLFLVHSLPIVPADSCQIRPIKSRFLPDFSLLRGLHSLRASRRFHRRNTGETSQTGSGAHYQPDTFYRPVVRPPRWGENRSKRARQR